MIADSFNNDAKDSTLITVKAPPEMSPRQALRLAVDIADINKRDVALDIYGVTIFLADANLASMREASKAYGLPAAQTAHLMRDLSMRTAFSLPMPAAALAVSYPFRSAAFDDFLNSPHDNADEAALMKKLAAIQEQYIDYLFDTLQETSRDKAPEQFDECCREIFNGILNHTSNSRTFMTAERRTLLIDELTKNGKITEDLERIIGMAGLPQKDTVARNRSSDPAAP